MHRHVASIREIVGYDGLQVVSSEVFSAAPGAAAGHAVPTASITDARVGPLKEYGYSPGAWTLAGVAG